MVSPGSVGVVRTHNRPRLVLASASPARRKLLQAAGIEPEVLVSGVDESAVEAATAEELCLTLARLKAEAVRQPDALVLGCDSVLAFEGEILGKPADADEATKRWLRMRGRSGVLHTGHCLIDGNQKEGNSRAEAVAKTTVYFADVSDAEIAAYVATGEPLLVAGAFTIDGIGGAFVERVEGDHGNVIGLSLPLLRRLLGELGYSITDLWRR
ncbi:Maf-like protein [Micromonospora sp. CPCC 205371]|nr:Maf-like protein [Micromonospora sp. CPCC 205371]